MQRRTMISLAALAATLSTAALAQTGEIRIAHVYSKTGPFEAYGKQTQTGLLMGLNYATGGSMTINGKKLVVIEKDDQGKPDLGKSQLAAAYADDKADIAVGPSSSGVALAMLPVAEEYKKILLVEPAVADAITGDKWNKYIFRTGRNLNGCSIDLCHNFIIRICHFGKGLSKVSYFIFTVDINFYG